MWPEIRWGGGNNTFIIYNWRGCLVRGDEAAAGGTHPSHHSSSQASGLTDAQPRRPRGHCGRCPREYQRDSPGDRDRQGGKEQAGHGHP